MYEKYPFDEDYQHKILACIMEHPEKFMGRAGILNANYFTGLQVVVTARVMFNHFRKHQRFPDWPVLRREVYEDIAPKSETDFEKDTLTYLDRLESMETDDAEQIAERITQWVKHRAIYLFIDEHTVSFTEGKPFNPVEAISQIEDITRIGFDATLVRNAVQLANATIDPDDTLLGDRFLCREGGMLFAASSGVGKSVASNQMAVAWACGREALGIEPARPLKILVIQAEDDSGDCREMLAGVMAGLNKAKELTGAEWKLIEENTLYERECTTSGDDFIVWLNERVYTHRPDLVIINPLNSYIGGKGVMDPATVTKFLRGGINVLCMRYRIGVVIVHHTPKTNNKERDTQKWRPSDWVYTYAGVNEIGNWCRAALAIEATFDPLVFKFVGAKRGRRIGWKNDFLEPELIRYFRQSKEKITIGGEMKDGEPVGGETIDKLFWEDATEEDIARADAAAEESKKNGRPKNSSDTALLKPLRDAFKDGKGLTQAEWLDALFESQVGISQPTLSRRARDLKRAGKVSNENGAWWFVEAKKGAAEDPKSQNSK